MDILLDETQLENLLLKNKEKIGHNRVEGIDTIFAALSLLASALSASYATFFCLSGSFLKRFFIIVSVLFGIWGVIQLICSIIHHYGQERLMKDIKDLNLIQHPFSIAVIHDDFQEFPNRFLLYYDTRWNCWFFPNFRTVSDETDNMANIRDRLSKQLKIPAEQISAQFVTSRIQQKFSVSDRQVKVYDHRLYRITLPASDLMKQDSFIIDDRQFCWKTIDEMRADPEIQEKNLDVVSFVEESII